MTQRVKKSETYRRTLKEKGQLAARVHPPKKREGDIAKITQIKVVTMAPTTPIYDAIQLISKEGFRRIPIVDPGARTLLGIVTATDIVNYLGGGDKFNIIQKKFAGNIFQAIHEPVKAVMTRNVVSIQETANLSDALERMKQYNLGGLPVVDAENRVKGIVTERDFMRMVKGKLTGTTVSDFMTKNVVVITPHTSILEAERTMIQQGFRRLPIVAEKKLLAIVTAMDVIRFFGSRDVFKHLQTGTIMQILQLPISEISSKTVFTATPTMETGEAARLMQENDVGALPVVENGRLVGMITERDLFKLLA